MTTSHTRTLLLASLGGALEFYDFVIFVFFTSVIAQVFFPPHLPDWLRQVQTYGIFAIGYLARPLGGIVLAHFGDTRGRKRIFTLSLFLMAIPTLLIGFLPTYSSIGIAAPLLLLLLRVIQGIAIGGEVPGAWVFVAEHAGHRKAGLAIGLLTGGLATGILLGSLTTMGLDLTFSREQIVQGAWRIPFLIGGLFGFVAMLLRRLLAETAVFREMQERAALAREIPLRLVLRDHGKAIWVSTLSACMSSVTILVVLLMTPSLLQKSFSLAVRQTQWANCAGTATAIIFGVLIGVATDRFGIRPVAVPALLLMVASTYALYFGAEWNPASLLALYMLAGAGVSTAVLGPVVMVRAFPAAVRFSGVSFSYNVTYAVIGGVTPPLLSWLSHLDPICPAHYVAIAAIIGSAAILLVAPPVSSDSWQSLEAYQETVIYWE